ncbi:MAG: hypothetical protein RLZZ253_1107 [Verrucomicrobiota bacterium]
MTVSGVVSRQALPRPIVSRVCASSEPGLLNQIRDNGWDMAVWNREMPREISEAAQVFAAGPARLLMDVRVNPEPAVCISVEEALADCQPLELRVWLGRDIQELAERFARALDCETVRIRLHRVVDKGCAAFHVDTLSARLLCTYAGAGMEWVDEPDVRRNELGLNGRSLSDANRAIVPDTSRIRELKAGAVGIFKGRLWGDGSARGLVHRSPPGCCEKHARLRLLIDPGHSQY